MKFECKYISNENIDKVNTHWYKSRRASPIYKYKYPLVEQSPLLEQFRRNSHLKFACWRIGLCVRAMGVEPEIYVNTEQFGILHYCK